MTVCVFAQYVSAPVINKHSALLFNLPPPGSRIPHQLCLIATGFKSTSSLNNLKSQVVPSFFFPLKWWEGLGKEGEGKYGHIVNP